MLFQNEQIIVDTLPQSETIDYQKVAPAYLKVSIIGTLIFFGLLAMVIIVVWLFSEVKQIPLLYYGIPALWLFLTGISLWVTERGYRLMGYAVREHDILFREGIFFRSVVAIPFKRVQHVEVKEGPIERMFGLKTLEVYTAGGQSSDLSISGLQQEEAQRLKVFVIQNTARHA